MRLVIRRVREGARDGGYTLVELISVMAILMTILTSLTALFVSGAKAELDADKRFRAQQEARIAVDRMRREVHCASGITLTSAASVSVSLPAHCPTAGGVQKTIVYDTQASGAKFVLRRAGVKIAGHLTSGNVFSYTAPSPASLGKLNVTLSVNVSPTQAWPTWRLESGIVLRNTVRA